MSNKRRVIPRKKDSNQPDIEKALEYIGASTQSIHTVGRGCPDLLVGWQGQNFVFEVKSKGGKLLESEENFARDWKGQLATVWSLQDVFDIIGYTHTFDYLQFTQMMLSDGYTMIAGTDKTMWKHEKTRDLVEIEDWLAYMVMGQTPPIF